ncbi:unnamed protein product, partial [Adineta ricciae]
MTATSYMTISNRTIALPIKNLFCGKFNNRTLRNFTTDELSSSIDNDSVKQFQSTLERNAIFTSSPTAAKPILLKRLSFKSNKRYSSKFKREWLSNSHLSSFLCEFKSDTMKALCIVCNIQFSIQNSGLGDIHHYIETNKHKQCTKAVEANPTKPLDSTFYITTTELNRLSAVGGAMKHFFFSVCYDASNKGNAKMLPIAVQFISRFGVRRGILDFIEQSDESADALFKNIKYVLEAPELRLEQLASLGFDNINVNVGDHHSVFSLFEKLLPK